MELLPIADYTKVIQPLKQVTINSLFAQTVVEQKTTGKIYVDNPDNPTTFYVVHPYGMTLLFGASNHAPFNLAFKAHALNTHHTRDGFEWMQAFPNDWAPVLATLFSGVCIPSANNTQKLEKGIVELNTRVNFKFNPNKHEPLTKNMDPDISILRATGQMFSEMQGSVVPLHFWNSEEDFLKNGMGFALFYKGELASMSFSSYWLNHEFEMGIETKEKFRGYGLAELVCRALIDYCVKNGYTPIWSCRLENVGSYKLAQKLGFEPTLYLPYYRLSK